MKLTNYEKIKSLLEEGHCVKIKFNTGRCQIAYAVQPNGCVLLSRVDEDVVKSLNSNAQGWNESSINTWDITSITVIPRKPKVLKPGTKVKILSITREIERFKYWNQEYKDMVGSVDKIVGVEDDYKGVFYRLQHFKTVPVYCVREVFDDKPKKTTLTMKQVAEKFGLDVNSLRIKK